MIKFYYKDIKTKRLRDLEDFKKGSWVYVESPSTKEIKFLKDKFDLEEGLLRDAVDIYEVPRFEVEKGKAYIFTRFAYWQSPKIQLTAMATNGSKVESTFISTEPLLIVMTSDFLMTISLSPLPFLKRFLEGDVDFYTTQKNKLFFAIFGEINSIYNSFLHNISKLVRSTTIKLEEINNKDIVQFVTFESVLNDFLSAIEPTNVILKNLLSGKYLKLHDEDQALLEDLVLNNTQLIEISQANLRNIVNIREAYSTIITNNLNRIIRLLTSLTVILAVPTMIASIYGMNIQLPMADSPHAFSTIITLILSISVVATLIFIKNRWL